MMRLRFDEPRPLTCHILLTTACNYDCDGCFYRKDELRDIPFDRLVCLLEDLASEGVKSVAFGGGEPTLYPRINEAIHEAKVRGFYVAVTTNGAVKHDFDPLPDRVHISYDAMHREATRRKLGVIPFVHVKEVLKHYKDQGITTGINHIYHSYPYFNHVDIIFSEVDNITILLEKTVRDGEKGHIVHHWKQLEEHIAGNERYWLDACLVKLMRGMPCKQGISSFSIDQNLVAHRCSNTEAGVPYTTVKETWQQLTGISDCILPQ